MAKFIKIDPNLLKNQTIRRMPTAYKLFWVYLMTNCDQSGVWIVDWDEASYYIGEKIDPSKAKDLFLGVEDDSENAKAIEFDRGRKWLLPKFANFQIDGIKNNGNWAKSIKSDLAKHGIDWETMRPFEKKNAETLSQPLANTSVTLNQGLNNPSVTLTEPLANPPLSLANLSLNTIDENKYSIISIEGGMGGDNFSNDFESHALLYRDFIQAYGDFGRQQKRGAIEQALIDAMRKLKEIQPEATWNQCSDLLIYQAKQACKADQANGQTKRLNPETWLNNRVYETNIDLIKQPTKLSPSQRMDAALDKFAAKILGGQNDK